MEEHKKNRSRSWETDDQSLAWPPNIINWKEAYNLLKVMKQRIVANEKIGGSISNEKVFMHNIYSFSLLRVLYNCKRMYIFDI